MEQTKHFKILMTNVKFEIQNGVLDKPMGKASGKIRKKISYDIDDHISENVEEMVRHETWTLLWKEFNQHQ